MSVKRPLSPELSVTNDNDAIGQLKRFKLHSIIEELRNEEAYLVLLKKLRSSQRLLKQTNTNTAATTTTTTTNNNNVKAITNGCHQKEKPIAVSTTKPVQSPILNLSSQQHPSVPDANRKISSSSLLANTNPVSKSASLEQYKTQAKLALRKQLERDLLSISLPKPSLQDVIFIPNGTSLEYQLFLGLEDVVECLNELQNSRHRLPQRFTDQAYVNEPYICDHCGTDFTIRWWTHLDPKTSNHIRTMLCDRCKKQVTRRAAKSDHSALLKNVFLSAMKQEKEIDKQFNSFIKQQKILTQPAKPPTAARPQTTLVGITPTKVSSTNHSHHINKIKSSSIPSPLSKPAQPTMPSINSNKKANPLISSRTNHSSMKHGHHHHHRPNQHPKVSAPAPAHHHQQSYRTTNILTQQLKTHNQTVKMQKTNLKHQTFINPSNTIRSPHPLILNSLLSADLVRPQATKRSTFPTAEKAKDR